MTRPRSLALVAAAVLVVPYLLTGCAEPAQQAAPQIPDDPVEEAVEPTPAAPLPGDTVDPELDGPDTPEPVDDHDVRPGDERFGFLVAVDTAAGTITFDEATWIADDGEPNGYRIENPDHTTEVLPVASGTLVSVLWRTGDPTSEDVTDLLGLSEWFDELGTPDEAAFDVIVHDGAVTSLAFRYRP